MAAVLNVFKPYLARLPLPLPLPPLSGTTIVALGIVIVTAIIFYSLSAATSTITIHKKLIGHHLGHGLDDHLDVSDFEPDDLDDDGRPRPPASARSPSVVRITSLDPSSPLCAAPIRIIDDGSGIAGNKVFLPPPAQDVVPDPALLSPSLAAPGIASSSSSMAGSDTSSLLGSDAGSSTSRRRHSLSNRRHSVSSVKRSSISAASATRSGKKRSDSLGRRASKRSGQAILRGEQSGGSGEDGAEKDAPESTPAAEEHLSPGSSTPLSASLSPSSSEGTWHDADEDSDQELASAVSHQEHEGPTTPSLSQDPSPTKSSDILPSSASSSSSLSSVPSTPSPRQAPSSPSTRARRAAAAVQAWHETPPPPASSSERKTRLPPNVPLPATPLIRLTGAGVPSSGRGRQREHSSSDADSVRLSGSHHGHMHLHKRTTPPSILRRQPQPFKSAFLPLPSKGRALKAARFLVFPPELEREWQLQVQRSQIQHALLARQEVQKAQQLLSGPSTTPVLGFSASNNNGSSPSQAAGAGASTSGGGLNPTDSADSSLASTGSASSSGSRPPTPPEKDSAELQLGANVLPGTKHVRPPPPPPSNPPLAPSASINGGGANPAGSPWTPASPWVDTPSGSGTATPMYASASAIGGFMHPHGLLIGNGGRRRTIRMREPDWTPYTEMHPRAREREEMRSRTLLARRASVSSVKSAPAAAASDAGGGNKGLEPSGSFSAGKSKKKKGRRRSNSLLLGSAVIGSDRNSSSGADDAGWEEEKDSDEDEDGSKGRLPKVQVDDVGSTSFETVPDSDEDEEEFWFERFTRSTAAAGRDWDWRKRRARILIPAPPPNLRLSLDASSQRGRPTMVSGDDGSGVRPGNVGKDAVDIVHEERRAAAGSLTVPSAQPSAPASNGLTVVTSNNRPSSPRLASPRASPRKASLPLTSERDMPVPVFGAANRTSEGPGGAEDLKPSSSPSEDGVQPFPQSSPEPNRSPRSTADNQGSPSSSPKSGRRLALSSLTQGGGRGPPSPPSTGKGKGLRAKMALRLNAWTGGLDAETEAQMRERRTSADSDLGQKRGLDAHLSSSEVFKIARRRTSSEGNMLEVIAGDEQRGEDDSVSRGGGEGGGRSWRQGSDTSVPVRLSSLTSGRAGNKPPRQSSSSTNKSERRKRHTSFGSILRSDDRVQQLLSEAEMLSSDDESTSAKVGGGKNVPAMPSIVLNGHHRVDGGGDGKLSEVSPKFVVASLPKLTAEAAPEETQEILTTSAAASPQPPAVDVFSPPFGLPQASPRTTSIPKDMRPRASDGSTPTTVRASRIPQTRRTSDTSTASSISTSISGTEGHGGLLPNRAPVPEQRSEAAVPASFSSRRRILNDAMGAQLMPSLIPSESAGSGLAHSPAAAVSFAPPSAWTDTASRLPRRSSNSSFSSTTSSNGKTSPGYPSLIPVAVSLSSRSSSSSLSSMSSPPSPSGLTSSANETGRQGSVGSGSEPRSQLPQYMGTASPTERVRRRTSANLAQADLIRHFSRADPQSMLPYPSSRV
ncbi:hypothetical protein OC845_006242 [Tilletia horrida]|nr:hypothetical protein OC845_006242 [Tilletia horrida]